MNRNEGENLYRFFILTVLINILMILLNFYLYQQKILALTTEIQNLKNQQLVLDNVIALLKAKELVVFHQETVPTLNSNNYLRDILIVAAVLGVTSGFGFVIYKLLFTQLVIPFLSSSVFTLDNILLSFGKSVGLYGVEQEFELIGPDGLCFIVRTMGKQAEILVKLASGSTVNLSDFISSINVDTVQQITSSTDLNTYLTALQASIS